MFKRQIAPLIEKALNRSPVVLLNGARQVGKTTLALEFLKEKGYTYLTFDDEITYLAALQNTSGFIAGLQKPVILDEVQRVPEIFLAIKSDVDKNRVPGNYLLTGSANPLLLPRMGDSLAGRMEIIDVFPLSQGEIHSQNESFIDYVFSDQQLKSVKQPLSKKELYQRILIGGYPLMQNISEEDRDAWMRSYLNLLLQRDIRDLAQIEKLVEFPNLLKILASRASGLLNVAAVARETKMVANTVNRYLALLETIFIVSLQPSWHTNLTARYVKAPKLYFVDTGLLAYLMAFNLERAQQDQIQMGKLVENFVINELQKQATWNKTQVNLFHFRTLEGIEGDIVLEDRAGNIVGLEIKSSEAVSSGDFKGLRHLKEKAGKKFKKGIVLYTGTQSVAFDEDLYALPLNCLWE